MLSFPLGPKERIFLEQKVTYGRCLWRWQPQLTIWECWLVNKKFPSNKIQAHTYIYWPNFTHKHDLYIYLWSIEKQSYVEAIGFIVTHVTTIWYSRTQIPENIYISDTVFSHVSFLKSVLDFLMDIIFQSII